jgi:transposase-like protein
MRFRDWDRSAQGTQGTPEPVPTNVTKCPFCESQSVTTTGNALLSSTYWRCQACGEIWNPARQAPAAGRRRW